MYPPPAKKAAKPASCQKGGRTRGAAALSAADEATAEAEGTPAAASGARPDTKEKGATAATMYAVACV